MENANNRQIGPRHTQFKVWIAALVLSEQTKRPVAEILPKLVQVLGTTLRQTDIRGAFAFQKHYEATIQSGLDLVQNNAGGLDPSNPVVVRLMTTLSTGEPQLAGGDDDPTERPSEAPAAIPEAPLQSVYADDGFLFDGLPPDTYEDVTAEPESEAARQRQEALDLYAGYVSRLAKIPTIPYSRPDLGVTFFPTGRFDVGGVDWNYNGQVGGEMLSDCDDRRLVTSRGSPLKASLDFEGWLFGKDQRASGALWIWAVKHGNGKQMRFWLNDGKDKLRFYYTMDATGVNQIRKKPEGKGSKKFVVVDQRHIAPLTLEVAAK